MLEKYFKAQCLPLAAVLVAISLSHLARAWPSGAPESTCDTLAPRHGNNRGKTASSPFTLSQSHEDYVLNDRVKITLRAPRGISFKGLIVQAFDPQTNRPVGSFQPGRGLKTIDSCSAVTHTDRRGKRAATLVWVAPADKTGRVQFKGTIVQRFSEFYENVVADVDPNA